jgi:HEPN domain-containing protein
MSIIVKDETQDWLVYARRDWAAAQYLAMQDRDFVHQVCFLAQQAVEKGLKAIIITRGMQPRRTHDLERLVKQIPKGCYCAELTDLEQLTEWAVASRYPSQCEPPPSKKDADIALKQATTILGLVEKDLSEHGAQLRNLGRLAKLAVRSRYPMWQDINKLVQEIHKPAQQLNADVGANPEIKSRVKDETKDWLVYARRDWAAAQYLATQDRDFVHQVCFLAQQAVEKGLKAIIITCGMQPRRTHDLERLVKQIPKGCYCAELTDLEQLTEWAVASRYPSRCEPPPSKKDADVALKQATTILGLVEKDLFRLQDINNPGQQLKNHPKKYNNQQKSQRIREKKRGLDFDY